MLIFYSLSGRPPPHFPLSEIEWNILLSTPCMQSTLSHTRCVGRGRVQRNVFRRRHLNLRPLRPTTLSPSKPDRETPSLHPPPPYSEKKKFSEEEEEEAKRKSFRLPPPFSSATDVYRRACTVGNGEKGKIGRRRRHHQASLSTPTL